MRRGTQQRLEGDGDFAASDPCRPHLHPVLANTCTPNASCGFSNIIVLQLHLTHDTSRPTFVHGNRQSPFPTTPLTSPDGGRVWTGCCRTCATCCGR
jgi:hypothetical protein